MSAIIKLNDTEIAANNGAYTLETGTYTVTLTANGDASIGYAVVTVGKTEIYRGQLKLVEIFSFTLVANKAATLEIKYHWGTAATPHSSIQDGTYTHGTASIAEEDAPNEDKNDDPDATEPTEETTPPTTETQFGELSTQQNEETTAPQETESSVLPETADTDSISIETQIPVSTDNKNEIVE